MRAHCAVVADGAAAEALAAAFFELVESYDGETRARLLLFATGYARLPPGGFARLAPRLTVTVDARGDPARLPTAAASRCAAALGAADLAAKLGVALAHGAHFGLR
ncbi:ubiquitin protein ligase [Aureococcus anophagefferens]|nr:ubiquitin protein ligase [Aureococcus anophagefferens]